MRQEFRKLSPISTGRNRGSEKEGNLSKVTEPSESSRAGEEWWGEGQEGIKNPENFLAQRSLPCPLHPARGSCSLGQEVPGPERFLFMTLHLIPTMRRSR